MGKKEWADNSAFEYIFNFIKEKKNTRDESL